MHLESYLSRFDETESGIAQAEAVRKTAADFVGDNISSFTHMDSISGLLLGEVQSGKTARVFGVIAATADEDPSFVTFILLTSNNVALQRQTLKRALSELNTFNVCDESDDFRFVHAGTDRPSLVVLKKDPNVLRSWLNHLNGTERVARGPIFVVDDEADQASPNIRINQKEKSTIFKCLEEIRRLGTSSIYLQVTATPQALFLQSEDSEIRPQFVTFFEPGRGYVGGRYLFSDPLPHAMVHIEEKERDDLLESKDVLPDGLVRAVATFVVTCAQFAEEGRANANMLVHPSIAIGDHSTVYSKVDRILRSMRRHPLSKDQELALYAAHSDLKGSQPELLEFAQVREFASSNTRINVFTVNSTEDAEKGNDFASEFNIVIGGNSLGRGVTFSNLQTVYYCRTSKSLQSDTYWQHSRVFGYDRKLELLRVFMPASLIRAFHVFSEANETLIELVKSGAWKTLQIVLPSGYSPTRKSVIERSKYSVIVGGTNYFPPDPTQTVSKKLNRLLSSFNESRPGHKVTADLLIELLNLTDPKTPSWPAEDFASAIRGLEASTECRLIVRRARAISKNTGTLLSPDDRKIGKSYGGSVVVTAYELTGEQNLGWEGSPFWILNIKLPEGKVFHQTH
ncbi:MAG: hypothetical protein KF844_09145 [Cryobacterium sp.]|nr:hypothetical protein [Cryobacterium sp.]